MNKNIIERLEGGKGVLAVIVENGKIITCQSLYTPLDEDTSEEYENDNRRLLGELINSFFALRNSNASQGEGQS